MERHIFQEKDQDFMSRYEYLKKANDEVLNPLASQAQKNRETLLDK